MWGYFKEQSGTAVAILLGLLALLVAGTGTAIGAVNTVVSIGDPVTATRIARVDGAGRLSVAPAASPLIYQNYFFNSGVVNITSATTATLVLTSVRVTETLQNGSIAGSDLTVRLVQNSVDVNGNCTTTPVRYLALTALSSGQERTLVGDSPVQVKPLTPQTKYCLGIYSVVTNGAADSTSYYPYVTWAGYAGVGTYTGVGSSFAAGEPQALPPKKPQT